MKILIIFLCLVLTGCGGFADQPMVAATITACKNNEGLKNIELRPLSVLTAYCNNGAIFKSKQLKKFIWQNKE